MRAPHDGYGETRELLEHYAGRIRVTPRVRGKRAEINGGRGGNAPVLMIDSAVSDGFFARLGGCSRDVSVAIFDTTCFACSSGRIGRVVRWAERRNLPIVLVRSHAKLDSLGIEYGRLGSIVLVWHRDDACAC